MWGGVTRVGAASEARETTALLFGGGAAPLTEVRARRLTAL
jgi:hypothetical protein